MDLIDKDFISVVINMFKELKETMFKELKKNLTTISYQIQDINKEIEIIKQTENQ